MDEVAKKKSINFHRTVMGTVNIYLYFTFPIESKSYNLFMMAMPSIMSVSN